MNSSPEKFEEWLAAATKGLDSSIRQRLRLELASHFQDAYEDLTHSGISADLAESSALRALGDPEAARKHFRDEYGSELPWLSNNFPPRKPSTDEFGYLNGSKYVGCSREKLIQVCRKRGSQIDFVWTPDAERLVPIQTIPFLFEAIKAERISNFRVQFVCAIAMAAITLLSAEGTWIYSSWRNVVFFVLLVGILPASIWLGKLKEAHSLAPEHFQASVEKTDALRFWMWFRFRNAEATVGLLLLISIVTIIGLVLNGIFISSGAIDQYVASVGLVESALFKGEWWRVFTSISAQSVWALGLNLPTLYFIGSVVEIAFGPIWLLIVFFTSALVAAGFNVMLSDAHFIGASGGILGLIGFILSTKIHDETFWNLRSLLAKEILVLAACGLLAFDLLYNAAHLGGLLAGLFLGWITPDPQKAGRSPWIWAWGFISAVALIIGALGAIYLCLQT